MNFGSGDKRGSSRMYTYFQATQGAGVYDRIVAIAIASKIERE